MLPIAGKSSSKSDKKANDSAKNQGSSAPDFTIAGNKVHFISLGCPRNLVDTEVMLGLLLKAGYEIAESLPTADFIIINTCGFLEASRKESLDTIKESLKEKKASAKVIATGCMVQTHSDVIRTECPDIHYLVGSGDVPKVLNAVESEVQGEAITTAKSYLEMGEVPRQVSTPRHFAYLKIAEGCRKRCAFCIIPNIKGPLKSKPEAQVTKELKILLDNGAKEIVLIAQDLGDWGKDAGFSQSQGLVHLLRQVLETEKRDFWLRLLYLYPDEISDELIQLMKEDKRICHYLDMPIQHVNSDLLKSMRR
ncbi:MAG TPA: MiaB/RimO family radical SAM methylthiotransferase, partial [Chlamydiales bacterium]|nr:MiaB/RimO family radical SAM methylthiotransferase [Chlamydiales bacterium]